MSPPLSIAGVWEALRWPTSRDLAFSLKAFLAIGICLLVGFSQDLLNPYWSCLTVYIVLMQPESGAIRSKALYRLVGTIGGGLLIMLMTGLAGDQLGILLALNIVVITLSTWARGVDRTPFNYLWFSAGLTAGFIGLVDLQTPSQIFSYATARMAEISVGIVAMAVVDSAIWPKHMLPDFLATMDEWQGRARDWVTDALERTGEPLGSGDWRRDMRTKLRQLTETIGDIDQKIVQLPYDTVAAPPRRRDLQLLRRTVARLVTDLAAIEDWARAMRATAAAGPSIDNEIAAVDEWVRGGGPDGMLVDVDHVADLRDGIAAARLRLEDRNDRRALVEQGMLARLDGFVVDWSDLAWTMRSVATRKALPDRLDDEARAAKPVRSIDYVVASRDALPLPVAMSLAGILYYLFAWSSGSYALLFSFIGCAFLIGQPQTLRSGVGIVTWVSIAFVGVFAYQFAILPRVTAFPVLLAVFFPFLFLVGLLLAYSLAGLFIAVFFFAFLSLQNTYTGNFQQSLLSLGGAMSGLVIAILCLHVFGYDKPRFSARRIVAALRGDIADAALLAREPDHERFRQLTIDRLAQFFPAIDKIGDDDDPLARVDVLDDMMIGLATIGLRDLRPALPADAAAGVGTLLGAIGDAFRDHPVGSDLPDTLLTRVDMLLNESDVVGDRALARQYQVLLMGMRLRLASDRDPFGSTAEDEGEDAPAADAEEHEDAKGPFEQ